MAINLNIDGEEVILEGKDEVAFLAQKNAFRSSEEDFESKLNAVKTGNDKIIQRLLALGYSEEEAKALLS